MYLLPQPAATDSDQLPSAHTAVASSAYCKCVLLELRQQTSRDLHAVFCRLLDARTLFDLPSQVHKAVAQVRDISTSFLCLVLIQPFLSLVTVLITLGSVRQALHNPHALPWSSFQASAVANPQMTLQLFYLRYCGRAF